MCPKGSPLDSMARKRIAKIGRDIFERTIPASFTHAREDARARWTGKPLQIAVDGVPGTTGGDADLCRDLSVGHHVRHSIMSSLPLSAA